MYSIACPIQIQIQRHLCCPRGLLGPVYYSHRVTSICLFLPLYQKKPNRQITCWAWELYESVSLVACKRVGSCLFIIPGSYKPIFFSLFIFPAFMLSGEPFAPCITTSVPPTVSLPLSTVIVSPPVAKFLK